MLAMLLPVLLPLLHEVIGGVIQDKQKADELNTQIQIALMNKQADLDKSVADAAKAQADVNLAEAQSASMFVAGWRPGLGWVCVLGFLYSFLLQPVLSWIAGWVGAGALPALDMGQLMPLALGMLGLGAMRSAEKIQGVDRQSMKAAPPASGLRRMFR